MNLLAHLTKRDGLRAEQSLKEHCVHTAKYASACLKDTGLYHMAYMAGLLHDMGKATEKFHAYLEDGFAGKETVRGSVNHSFAGVIYVLENFHGESAPPVRKLAAEIISYAIGAHHGLFDCVDLEGRNGFLHRLDKDRETLCYEEAVRNFFAQVADEEEIKGLFGKAAEEFGVFYQKTVDEWRGQKGLQEKVLYQAGLLTRLLLSAVIYGDRRDTGEFMGGVSFLTDAPAAWTAQREYFEQKLARFDAGSEIDRIRSEISDQCLRSADRPAGIYRLQVPTGGGKTLCSLRYALAHAQKYHKKKIIFIIPLLSVLDQNARVIREYLQDGDLVLEHHSNVIQERDGRENEELDPYEVLTENWGKPVIISTLVQLLNILFTHRTSAIGRMRALCDSVIVIDEVQSVPKKAMAMFNMALNFLSSCCNATVVLSSATQPCLEELDWPVRLAKEPDMVRLTGRQLAVFERAEIIDRTDPYGMDMEECGGLCRRIMEEQSSLLVICNTKREARQLYEKMRVHAETEGWHICHLSTAMCQRHRMDVLEQLQDALSALQERVRKRERAEKVICISTQLVEAGVDFSFSCVVRVLAGIDNLAQAAGRCNRSNEYGHKGKVYLVNLKDENLSMLKEIADAQSSTRRVLMDKGQVQGDALIGEEAARAFYRYLFLERDMKRLMKYPIVDCGRELLLADLLAGNNPYAQNELFSFLQQPFKTAAMRFQVFDSETFDVLVPYRQGKDWIDRLKEMEGRPFCLPPFGEIMEQVKRYTVSLYKWQRDRLWEEGLLQGMFGDRMLVLQEAAYHKQYGLDDGTQKSVEDFIV